MEGGKGMNSDGKHTVIYCALILVLFGVAWLLGMGVGGWGWKHMDGVSLNSDPCSGAKPLS